MGVFALDQVPATGDCEQSREILRMGKGMATMVDSTRASFGE
jgi:hypothetical protein